MLAFGSLQGAEAWLEDTGCGLEMFLDPDRRLYRTLGLHRSLAKVWSSPTIHYYAGQAAAGRQLPAAVAGGEDDPLQMGGDFTLVARSGRLVLCHPSSHPRDRPSLASLLARMEDG